MNKYYAVVSQIKNIKTGQERIQILYFTLPIYLNRTTKSRLERNLKKEFAIWDSDGNLVYKINKGPQIERIEEDLLDLSHFNKLKAEEKAYK